MITENTPPDFPAGEYCPPDVYGDPEKMEYAQQLRDAPAKIRASVDSLNDEQLNSVYKNWSIRQIVHHLADSHMNAYIRFKWALTEASPLIKSYDETKWSEVVDAKTLPVESSLILLNGLHLRWSGLVESLDEQQMELTYFHPEISDDVSLFEALPNYVWHTDHHVSQIHWIRDQRNW